MQSNQPKLSRSRSKNQVWMSLTVMIDCESTGYKNNVKLGINAGVTSYNVMK